ncbi:MAG: FKBP-type peptidyl-prolyl cis-trans isomerase [Cytophagaceae bacterium]
MNIKVIALSILLCSTSVVFAQKKKKNKETTQTMTQEEILKSQKDSLSYSLGVNIGTNLMQQGFDDINVEMLNKAFQDVFNSSELVLSPEAANQLITSYMQDMQKRKLEKNLAEGQKFLDENKKKDGVVTLPSGLQYKILKEGTGPKPKATDRVTTHYHGTLIDGTVFDSSVDRGQPATFPVNGVIQGWIEALQLMPVGSKWRLYIPAHLAYGERGSGNKIGPNAALIFDVELISIQ